MAGPIDVALRLASNTAQVGWFFGINRLIANGLASDRQGAGYRPTRPVPKRAALFSDLNRFMLEDAADASAGINPGAELRPARIGRHIGRLRRMINDVPAAIVRREKGIADTVAMHIDAAGTALPDYYTQDFHFQTGGHLADDSASLYDVQVETLFYGSGDAMRRAAFRPIHAFMQRRDQRRVALLDMACGTGRFLRSVRRAYPRLALTGLDLSPAYLGEAERHLGALRPVTWCEANAEAMPLEDGSQDIVTAIFLFHELPGEARRAVAEEVCRVLKPGGIFVMVDSLQYGDKPGWDGLLEAFPERFHEPYYRDYAGSDLTRLFADAGLRQRSTRLAFLSKVMAFERQAD